MIIKEFESFYNAMLPAQVNDDGAFAWFSGIPHPLFNAVMHINEEVETIISQAPPGIPLSFWVHRENKTANLAEALLQKGFQPAIRCPLMTWRVEPISSPPAVIVPADMEVFHRILGLDGAVKEGFAKLLGNIEAENYLISLEGKPVGTGTLFPKGKNGGIFNVATLPEYQKRGCGKAMTRFLMHRAATLGLEKLLLLSTPLAEKLYSDLGFTPVLEIDMYLNIVKKI